MSTKARQSADLAPQANDQPLRFVTAASLFDGHDAAINVMRRLIQAQGAEVIHLGHNRSVQEIVIAALQENADGIALSSYQGGHMEFFTYMVDLLRENGAGHICVFGGGGGTITLDEIAELQEYGVERIYHPQDGMEMGLEGMIEDLVARTREKRLVNEHQPDDIQRKDHLAVAKMISLIEEGAIDEQLLEHQRKEWQLKAASVPVLGITGTGGAGKSSFTDELLARFLRRNQEMNIAVLAVDPTRRRTGGALLGDRIRMNSLASDQIYMRSMATRRQHLATSEMLGDVALFLKSLSFDLIIIETAGIGQSDSEIVDLVDFSIYVMTSDYGAASQLEKIDMIDYADLIILNKYDKRGAEDALRDIRKQWRRNHNEFSLKDDVLPVYPTIASQFNDPGMNWAFNRLIEKVGEKLKIDFVDSADQQDEEFIEPRSVALIPGSRIRYLAEITEQGRQINNTIEKQADVADMAQHFYEVLKELNDPKLPSALSQYEPTDLLEGPDESILILRQRYQQAVSDLSSEGIELLRNWPERKDGIKKERYSYEVRGREITGDNYTKSLSNLSIPKLGAPDYSSWGELLKFLSRENLPGSYPYTAGVFPYRRAGEDPTRMFAGEGTPERTNRRFHYLSRGQAANRLSTAFDSVTLYGDEPTERPDIYGKVGNSGVSIATQDDLKKLYSGFDLCDPATSVSMTINGPAPIILAFFMNAAVDQQIEKELRQTGRWGEASKKLDTYFADSPRPEYEGALPEGNDGLGLGLLGISGDQVVDQETYERIKADTLKKVRGTVQADIFKEDQAQNTCIFSTDFAMKMMGDVQEYFIEHQVRNYYSVSISGYHIAEAGANPISQLAFTLSNGFTLVEFYLARGMDIDDFAPNLSFFFSNGMDPEYSVIGRVARRIWARAMRERYGASPRSQMLKYHIQTSGRSLHAQEMNFNDIRTTLQALYALFDNCNSLHTNAYDEAITTPTEESVRRAIAIQMIINKELGLNFSENPWQGSFIMQELTDLVEEAVYKEFDAISERGGVLGAMDTMYQRGKIQEESLDYESRKHDGSLPLIGVNTFLAPEGESESLDDRDLMRSTEEEKQQQITHLNRFKSLHEEQSAAALGSLRQTALERGNIFEALMEAVKVNSMGQISQALYQVGGFYRRNM